MSDTENNDGENETPIGAIIMWGGQNNIPSGWMPCDGRIVEIGNYAELYDAIAHNFGTLPQSNDYDPSKQFFIPDLRGRFVRGVDNTPDKTPRDPDRETRTDMQSDQKVGAKVGSLQADEFKSHTHNYKMYAANHQSLGSGDHFGDGVEKTTPTGGSETRPKNAYLYYIIKAR